MKSQLFQGDAQQVQMELSSFLKDKKIKIYGFAQSQSTVNDPAASNHVIITATLLYAEYSDEPKQVTGFIR
ncbi:MAG TPA: hypothetical protein VN721_08210 [Flavipsychrobacter sp.]|nr:hypothetical protein [Flavipsychrobacter sp.]